MDDLAIVCFSCDNNEEVWPTFMTCLDKYWPNHPITYLLTETLSYPYMHTINYNYDINSWSTRIYKSLEDIKENKIVFICDDCFLNAPVNIEKLKQALAIIKDNTATVNFELSFREEDMDCEYEGFKYKPFNTPCRLSFLCGLWDKEKLIDILKISNSNPWDLEDKQDSKGYDIYQVADSKILSWFRDGPYQFAAAFRGLWSRELPEFLEKEGITMDYDKKGFYDE